MDTVIGLILLFLLIYPYYLIIRLLQLSVKALKKYIGGYEYRPEDYE